MAAVSVLVSTAVRAEYVVTGNDITITAPRVQKSDVTLQPEALPANVSVVTAEDVKAKQVDHYLDMLRDVPGLALSTYAQGAIGDGIGMRGFFSDHGSQVAVYVDGVPLNWANSSHANGLVDLSWLAPEMVDRIDVIKGPVSALYGGFALGGVVNIITKKSGEESQVNAGGGSYGTYRGAAVLTRDDGKIKPFLVEEGFHQDGYRQNSNWSRLNSFNKVSLPVGGGTLSLRGGFVKQDWGAPGYIPLAPVIQGTLPRDADVNSSDGGSIRDANFVMNFDPKTGEAGFHGALYTSRETQDRFSTFDAGPQKWGLNKHTSFGWRGLYNYAPAPSLALAVGTDGQYADGRAASFATSGRSVLFTKGDWGFHQWTSSLFGQLQAKPLAWVGDGRLADLVKLVGGIREDIFDITVDNRFVTASNFSGTDHTSIVSPKAGIVVSPLKSLDVFANRGIGFRQPSVEEISPNDPTVSPNFKLDPSKIRSWDAGFNERLAGGRVRLNFDYYQSRLDREIVVVNDQPLNVDNTERNGYEASVGADIGEGVTVQTSYAGVRARDLTPDVNGGDLVPQVSKSVWTNTVRWTRKLSGPSFLIVNASSQLYGRAPLNATGSMTQPSIARWLGRVTYGHHPWEAFVGGMFVPQKYASDLELDGGGGRTFFDPAAQWTVTAGLRYSFKI
jgi:outer membrane receptor protein involved in Fe transport